mmetsp:Transcript_26072/g.104324  ORF Transcript_26072/g.104324 Transcript_26072/m.104324 type:complete len:138 (+) Transcript_26072:360-773(+)
MYRSWSWILEAVGGYLLSRDEEPSAAAVWLAGWLAPRRAADGLHGDDLAETKTNLGSTRTTITTTERETTQRGRERALPGGTTTWKDDAHTARSSSVASKEAARRDVSRRRPHTRREPRPADAPAPVRGLGRCASTI